MGIDKEVSDIIKNLYNNDSPEFFIQQVLDKMNIVSLKRYPNIDIYCISDYVYFELDKNKPVKILKCRYKDFWEVLEHKYNLEYENIQELIKILIEDYLKCDVGTPYYEKRTLQIKFEQIKTIL